MKVEFSFTMRPDGIIDATVGDGSNLLSQALNDSISSRAPRGALRTGLSTYWIDRAEEGVRRASRDSLAQPFASGNVTFLRLEGSDVVASFDFDPDGDAAEPIQLDDFVSLLRAWRQRVIEAGGSYGAEAQLVSDESPPRPVGPATG